MDQCFQRRPPPPVETLEHDKQGMGKWKLAPNNSVSPGNNSSVGGGGFDCSICLDLVEDPVVTLCGHLFCWPCIHKWIHIQTFSRCPVCKADVSEKTLIPLYGRGQSNNTILDGNSGSLCCGIPRRPASPLGGVQTLIAATAMAAGSSSAQRLHHNRRRYWQRVQTDDYDIDHLREFDAPVSVSLSGTTSTFHSSASSVLGETIYARIFGNQNQTAPYGGGGYPDSYHLSDLGSSPRVRRRAMQVDKSLSRISFFLLCFVLFCLVLF